MGRAFRLNNQQPQFDVFLAHNSVDKPQVRTIAKELKYCGLSPWLDEEQIRPGTAFQDEIQKAILQVKSAAIFIGPLRIGKWQAFEIKAFVSRCINKGIPVIPVLLPGVSEIPEGLILLQELKWVAFTNGVDDYEALDKLKWGVTGQKPDPKLDPDNPSDPGQKEAQSDDLSSEKGINYTKLQKLLKAEKWKEADRETTAVMLKVAGQEPRGYLFNEDIEEFPCIDLRTIDQLWVKYSIGRFGFSVQKRIFDSVNRDGGAFGERVGWRSSLWGVFAYAWKTYDQITFNLGAPEGHLPFRIVMGGEWMDWGMRISLFSRRDL